MFLGLNYKSEFYCKITFNFTIFQYPISLKSVPKGNIGHKWEEVILSKIR